MDFRLHTAQQALIFQVFSSNFGLSEAENCRIEVLKVKEPYTLVMFDFSKVSSIESVGLDVLAHLSGSILAQNRRVMVIASDHLTQRIEDCGYSGVLPCFVGVVPKVDDLIVDSKKNQEIDAVAFMQVVIPAVRDNLSVYAQLSSNFGIPRVCTQKDRPAVDIAGVGGFFCNNQKGNLLLCFQTESFLKVVSAIMKRKYLEVEPGISDWAAELANSVLGKVKTDLKAEGYSFSSGIPAVFAGKDLEVLYSTKLPPRLDIVQCSGEFGEFYIEIMMVPND